VGDDRPVWDNPHEKCVEAWSNCTLSGVSQACQGGGCGREGKDYGNLLGKEGYIWVHWVSLGCYLCRT
jgi:hypothetical protein